MKTKLIGITVKLNTEREATDLNQLPLVAISLRPPRHQHFLSRLWLFSPQSTVESSRFTVKLP
ncbi:hypothetical protein [Candidatus Electronema sp. TJ]|uniref:hypothetical protein n=1 Tax=Candidatus Electronema sp. TJ TaxID=3401573 RepID=UPI003AA87FA3